MLDKNTKKLLDTSKRLFDDIDGLRKEGHDIREDEYDGIKCTIDFVPMEDE